MARQTFLKAHKQDIVNSPLDGPLPLTSRCTASDPGSFMSIGLRNLPIEMVNFVIRGGRKKLCVCVIITSKVY